MKKIVTQPFGVLLGYYCYMSSPCDFKELSGRLGSHRPGQEIYLGPPLLFFFFFCSRRQEAALDGRITAMELTMIRYLWYFVFPS